MKLTITDNIMKFVIANSGAMDRALNRMAIDIERLSKEQVPVDHGQLRSAGDHLQLSLLRWVVKYDKVYARYQEFGGDGRRVVRNYSKPGSKAFYLKDPGDTIAQNALSYIKQEAGTIHL
jgi:hypothetical protein